MVRHKKPKDFLKVPQYPGGKEALHRFVKANLRYPEDALHKRVEGTVEAEYFVNGLGKITDVKILRGVGHGCDEEVIRLIKMLVFEKAVNRGLKTSTRKTLKVDFKLPAKQQKINYQLVPTPSPTPKPAPKTGNSYTISITYKEK